MDYHTTIRQLGSDDVTATFGVAPPHEIVGPLKPRSVHYGVAYGTDPERDMVMTDFAIPLLHFDFNKYRPDLPPWDNVREISLASFVESGEPASGTIIASFIEPDLYGIRTTGDLKTVTLAAEGPMHGLDDLVIIDRAGVEERRERLGV